MFNFHVVVFALLLTLLYAPQNPFLFRLSNRVQQVMRNGLSEFLLLIFDVEVREWVALEC